MSDCARVCGTFRSSEVNRATLRPSSAGSPLGGDAVSPVLLQPRALSLARPPRATSQQRVSVAPMMPLSKVRKCPHLAWMPFEPSVLILHSVHSLPPRGGHSCTSARPCARDSDPQFHVGVQDWGCLLRISFSSSLPDFSPPDLLRMSPVSADGDLGFLSPHPLPKLYLQGQELPSERATAFITSLQAASFLPASSQPNPSHHYSRPYFSATQRRPNARGC